MGVAAGFADGFGIHADDFAVVADEHYLRGFVDQGDGDDFADTLCRFDVDYTFAGAVGEAVFVGGSALAVAVFGYGEDQGAFLVRSTTSAGFRLPRLPCARARFVDGRSSPVRVVALPAAAPGFGVTVMPTT